MATTPGLKYVVITTLSCVPALVTRFQFPLREQQRICSNFAVANVHRRCYDTSNGIHADESGTAIDGVKAKGSYSYTDDDGKVYTIKYTADENGFRPIGDHLPTPPPIPIEIQAALNQIALDIETGNLDDGMYISYFENQLPLCIL
ncbi:hypothetical protein K1T71_010470 [Dendrolimus kikuchii]|uniref:Uncharacterized protein n=1 Tax=Dendrolimus kikuchii TaxID=765133 RepID=A0ACC1CSE4_9NEOP|nr:hypothetical protein K1T71_010470 [Dendrolimus kikuchii]